MQQIITTILTFILIIAIFQFYLEYINERKMDDSPLGIFLSCLIMTTICYLFRGKSYLFSPIIVIVLFYAKYYRNQVFSILAAACFSMQIYIISRCDEKALFFSFFLGIMTAFSLKWIQKLKQAVIYAVSLVFYAISVVLVCDFYFSDSLSIKHIIGGAANVFISIPLGLILWKFADLLYQFFQHEKYEKYHTTESEILLLLKKTRPDAYQLGDLSAKLAYAASQSLFLNGMKAATGARYFNIGMAAKNEYFKQGIKLSHEYHLPKIAERSIRLFFDENEIPKNRLEAVIYLASLTSTTLLYSKKKQETTDVTKTITRIIQNQIEKGTLIHSGLLLSELNIIKETFVLTIQNRNREK